MAMMRMRNQLVGMMMTSTVSVVVVAQLEEVEVWKGRSTGDDKAEHSPRRADGLSVGIQTKEHWHITDRCDTSRKVNHLRCDKYLVFVRSHLGHCTLIGWDRGPVGGGEVPVVVAGSLRSLSRGNCAPRWHLAGRRMANGAQLQAQSGRPGDQFQGKKQQASRSRYCQLRQQ
jgi:hypothetical protein